MMDCLRTLNREEGVTVLVTSHDMDDLTAMARRLVLLAKGKIAFDGTSAELLARTGDRRTLTLTRAGEAPAIAGASLLASGDGRHVYGFSGEDASRVLGAAAGIEGISDIEMAHAPIEDVIAGLYEDWAR